MPTSNSVRNSVLEAHLAVSRFQNRQRQRVRPAALFVPNLKGTRVALGVLVSRATGLPVENADAVGTVSDQI